MAKANTKLEAATCDTLQNSRQKCRLEELTRRCVFGRRRSCKVKTVTLADGPLHGFPSFSDIALQPQIAGWRKIRKTRSRNSSNGHKRQSSKGS